jgi:HAD superfamily phosphatase (TIGR01668 family)
MCPTVFAESVSSLNVAELKRRGIQALLIDLDNTLVPWRKYDVSPEVTEWLRSLDENGIKICIVSNSRAPSRLRRVSNELHIPYARQVFKPRRGGFREALTLLNVDATHAAVVGDQILTDVLGGNRLGICTILVRPLHRTEFVGTKISRLVEKILLRILVRRGMLNRSDLKCFSSVEQSSNTDSQMKAES